MEYDTVMSSEVKVDCYASETHDKVERFFETFCAGDKGSDTHTDDIVIRLNDLPAGAKVTVAYPRCPDCDIQRQELRKFTYGHWLIVGHASECVCGFDWDGWVLDQYS